MKTCRCCNGPAAAAQGQGQKQLWMVELMVSAVLGLQVPQVVPLQWEAQVALVALVV